MQGTPQKPNPHAPGLDIPIRIHVPISPTLEDGEMFEDQGREEERARGVYLKPRDFEKYGWTEGCEGCRRLRTKAMQLRPHTK
eukprot:9691298-Karenia_brevis.AAC.1